MSEYLKQRLLRTLLDLREEQAKADRKAENDRGSGHFASVAEGIGFAVDEITAALRIQGEEQWTCDLDQATEDQFAGHTA